MNDRGFVLESDTNPKDVYSKLEGDEIRTLLVAPGAKKSSVICEMQVIPHTESSQYEALSYVWGDVKQSRTLSCNGIDFAVTDSLHSALMNLRYSDSWRRLWVDQLCINQSADAEVLSQVSQMGKIYSSASRVVVWLGCYDRKMMQAWRLLQETALSSSLVRSDFLQSSPSPSPRKRPAASRRISSSSTISSRSSRSSRLTSSSRESLTSTSSGSPPRSQDQRAGFTASPSLKQCLAIFQHVWFSRKWTFQEAVLAKAAIICCGDVEMAWSDLTTWYFHYASKLRSSSMLYDSNGSFETIMSVRNELDKETLKLSNLLMLTRQRQSTKPEDAIYALLGLLPDLSKHLESVKHNKVDVDCLKLFLAVFRYCLEKEKNLLILSAAGIYKGSSLSDWPGWLPDWRERLPLRPLVLTADQSGAQEYSAAADTLPSFSLCDSTSSKRPALSVRGFRIGCISTKKDSWPNAYFVADRAAHNILAAGVSPSSFSQLTSVLVSSRTPAVHSIARSYSQKIIHAALQRNDRCEPARTSASVQADDWVCLFYGGPVLYVLRPLTEDIDNVAGPGSSTHSCIQTKLRCKFIGECAITGLMNGILIDFLDEGDVLEFELE